MDKGKVFECPPALNRCSFMDQSFQLESALSSIVSSPCNPQPPPPPPADSVVIRELLGRLGSICNSGEMEISTPFNRYMGGGDNSASTCCYSTPLNSPPKLHLSIMGEHHHPVRGGLPLQGNPVLPRDHLAPFAAAAGFSERATRLSCFGGGSYGGLGGRYGLPESDNRSRASSSQSISLKAAGSQMENKEIPLQLQEGSQLEAEIRSKFSARPSRSSSSDDAETRGAREESPATTKQVVDGGEEAGLRGAKEGNARKRKAVRKGKAKDIPTLSAAAGDRPKIEEDEPNNKRSKSGGDTNGAGKGKNDVKPKLEQDSNGGSGGSGKKPVKENPSMPSEPPKQDYIHVRARRGQATDSHSLAERVRRERISQRMKLLQDLVPGCGKVTGKAVMLDEIINYVQSLQRQVEFLSMKLATVNPRLDLNVESLLTKEMHHPRGSLPRAVFPLEASASAFPYVPQHHQQGTSLQNIVTNGLEKQCSLNPLDATDAILCRTQNLQLPSIVGFTNTSSQIGAPWEDDLQSVIQMGFVQNPEMAFTSQSFHGLLPTAHMKIEP